MNKKLSWLALTLLALALAGCSQAEPTPTSPEPTGPLPTSTPLPAVPLTSTPSPEEAPAGVLFSQVLPGVRGVNNYLEFIELYNPGLLAIDLDGWSVWYRLDDGKEEQRVYLWRSRADLPSHGHYLLVRAGQEVGALADAEFDLSLFEQRGGLALRDPAGQTVDAVVWGQGPESYRGAEAGDPAPVPEAGASLQRQDEGDAAAGWELKPTPDPRNSGDPPQPADEGGLSLWLDLPPSVRPGEEVTYGFEVRNGGADTMDGLHARLPLPAGFEILDLPEGAVEADGWIEGTLGELLPGETQRAALRLRAPWTYLSTVLRGAYAEPLATEGAGRAYAPLVALAVEGGAIPIGAARELVGERVTVEGVATMYTGGFFAGTTGTKFYLEDESGGIQVYCPGGAGLVDVRIGDRVRVSGDVEIYRDGLELVPPGDYDQDVEILASGGERPEPRVVSLEAATEEENLLGRLVRLEGTATRVEEFTYSYEVDLVDAEGSQLLVYVDKDAGLTAEPLEVGDDYRITGILELYNGRRELLPRYQSDMAEVFPPELLLEASAPSSVAPGGTVTYTLTVYNHTAAPLAGVEISAVPPEQGVEETEPLDGGQWEAGAIVWGVGTLPADGGSAVVRYRLVVEATAGQIVGGEALATAEDWPQAAQVGPHPTFIGGGVPLWAIQGAGDRSPYVGETLATEGLVTGIFPELEGFWIQAVPGDGDPATSDGVFVLVGENEVAVQPGDQVQLQGLVRERSGQTLLHLAAEEDLEVLASGLDLPEAVDLDPPLDPAESRTYYEALEGMLVSVSEPALVVGPTSQYGETALVRTEWGIERVHRGDPAGLLIFVDDGSSVTHADAGTLPFAAQVGDTLGGVVGPLAYTYENYKVEPIAPPVVDHVARPLPSLAPAGPDEFAVATFNVENLFDTLDPHPSDPPMPTRDEYALDLAKTAGVIAGMGAPEIVALQEVENIDVLGDLAAQEPLAVYDYQPFLIEGDDSRGIDVGYLVRADRATVEAVAARPAPDGLTSRPPLLITVTLHLETDDMTVYLLNNHFLSMSAGEEQTEPQRRAQAAWNVTLLERILADDPQAYAVVLGDLNSFYDSPPLDLLREAGLHHVYELVEPQRPYSYIYQGVSETLDHLLLTAPLYDHLVRIEVLHVDADYPPPLPDDPSPSRVSDHDPVIAVFAVK